MKLKMWKQNLPRYLRPAGALVYGLTLVTVGMSGLVASFDAVFDPAGPMLNLLVFLGIWWCLRSQTLYLVMGLSLAAVGLLGNRLYPGLFPVGLSWQEHLWRTLSLPGWLSALAIAPAVSAFIRIIRESVILRQHPLKGEEWIRFAVWRFCDVFGIAFALAARALLLPYTSTLGPSTLYSWWVGWPSPLPVIRALVLLWGQGLLCAAAVRQGGLQDTGHRAWWGVAVAAPLVAASSPWWSPRTGGMALAEPVGSWAAIWAYSPTTPAYWIFLCCLSAVIAILLSALSSLVSSQVRPAPVTISSSPATASGPGVSPTAPVQSGRPEGGGQPVVVPVSRPQVVGRTTPQPRPGGYQTTVQNVAAAEQQRGPQISRKQAFREGMKELDQLIGLDEVKKSVRQLLADVRVTQERRKRGLKTSPLVLHMAFLGSPGTGKTEVARIIGKLLYGMGLLRSGHFVEASRSTLVGQFVGETDYKTQEVLEAARGGVLFVDEAYELIPRGPSSNDFGYQALTALVKAMEDNREDLVVILAGYENEMERLWNANPGLRNRISYHIRFPDYSDEELMRILEVMAAKQGYRLGPGAREAAQAKLETMRRTDPHFANARSVRNLLQRARTHMSERLAQQDLKRLSNEQLQTLMPEDFAEVSTYDESPR